MHAGHKVVKCRRHGIVVMQCWCADANKPVEFQDECVHMPADVEVDRLRTELRQERSELATLRAKVAELEKDRERLDWIFSNPFVVINAKNAYDYDALCNRGEIDAAMKETE